MAYSQRKQEYNNNYNRENIKGYLLQFNKKTDADLIACLESKKNKTGYIKMLIREDLKK